MARDVLVHIDPATRLMHPLPVVLASIAPLRSTAQCWLQPLHWAAQAQLNAGSSRKGACAHSSGSLESEATARGQSAFCVR